MIVKFSCALFALLIFLSKIPFFSIFFPITHQNASRGWWRQHDGTNARRSLASYAQSTRMCLQTRQAWRKWRDKPNRRLAPVDRPRNRWNRWKVWKMNKEIDSNVMVTMHPLNELTSWTKCARIQCRIAMFPVCWKWPAVCSRRWALAWYYNRYY